jgi:AbrB family looped-hinge helix DNA binding protein
MSIARSKVTSQGQISIPAKVRRKLGIGPGSVLEWDEEGNTVLVRRAGLYSSEDIHRALFGAESLEKRTPEQMKEGNESHARRRYARH